MEAKEENYKEITKSNIILFLSYTVLIGFIFALIVAFVKYALMGIYNVVLSICLSLISGILIYHLLHFICKSSTLESLKKSSMDDENSSIFIKKMNLFFIICIIFSVIFCLGYLMLDKLIFSHAIAQAYEKYSFISMDLANRIADYIRIEYQNSFFTKIYSTVITELSLVISFISLIPYQKKVLNKYNKK